MGPDASTGRGCSSGSWAQHNLSASWFSLKLALSSSTWSTARTAAPGSSRSSPPPGAAGDRKDPHALGAAGPGAASGASPWPGAVSGLRPPNRDRSSDPATRAAAVGCVRVVVGPTEAARRQAITRRRHQRETHFGWAINARQLASRSQPVSKDRFKRSLRPAPVPLFCRIRGALGKKKGRLKSLSAQAPDRTPESVSGPWPTLTRYPLEEPSRAIQGRGAAHNQNGFWL